MSISMTYAIEHNCGQEEDRGLSATPEGQRPDNAEWLAGRPCFECVELAGPGFASGEVRTEYSY